MTDQRSASAEFAAIQTLYDTLEPLEREARQRVVNYVVSLLAIDPEKSEKGRPNGAAAQRADEGEPSEASSNGVPKFASIAELFDAARPDSNSNRALVAGYWLQVCQGAESFDGQSANKELKHLGHGVSNITIAINHLKDTKPALALQLKKSGTTRQARKTYKITTAGIRAVETMMNG